MPGLYATGDYDLGGFAVGAVERNAVLPRAAQEGDVLLGLASSGTHSNGYSLIRKVRELSGLGWNDDAPFGEGTVAQVLMTPTRIYVRAGIAAMKAVGEDLRGFAHITGGGLTENIPRVLPEGLAAQVQLGSWERSSVFDWIAREGGVEEAEMRRTFNCGIGLVAIVCARERCCGSDGV